MDILDNLMYASYISGTQPAMPLGFPPQPAQGAPVDRIISDYLPAFPALAAPPNVGSAAAPVFSYGNADKLDFCTYDDSLSVERAIVRHWFDIDAQVNYDAAGLTGPGVPPAGDRYSSFIDSSSYHLIYAYLLENTRMLQIFERLIERYFYDEEFGIADNNQVFAWIQNSERLFFKNDTPRTTNIRSLIRPNSDATRRNAYWRMFGMDLAFGDIYSTGGGAVAYNKAKVSNQQFVPLFEKYLAEVWQSYMNANNTSGINSSDINIVVDLARQLQEVLLARRGNPANTYANQNLSREEFSSVLLASWFTFIISDNTPVVNFLNCESSTIGERLHKIGNKVGIPAHSKSQALFEMAAPASNVLTTIEIGGVLDNPGVMPNILTSLIPPVAANTTVNMNLMTDLLTIINNWERATGHRIKTAPANLTGTVQAQQPQQAQQNGMGRVQQNGAGVKPKPAMN
jgi:hypothetical protein